MRALPPHRPLRHAVLALLLAGLSSCDAEPAQDPNNREIAWNYGPTTGGATKTHLVGTGKQGASPITKGWQCRLVDGKRLTVTPYQLAESHELFGKAKLIVGLYDRGGEELETVRSTPITPANATFAFDLDADVAAKLYDVVIWFGTP